MLSSVQVSPDGCYIGAISEQGNLLVFDVATLAKELRRVRNTSLMSLGTRLVPATLGTHFESPRSCPTSLQPLW